MSGSSPALDSPATFRSKVGEVLSLDVLLSNPEKQALDAIKFHLDYDPLKLDLISPKEGGDLALSPSQAFGVVLQNKVDRQKGQIMYAAGRFPEQHPVSDTPHLGTLQLQAKDVSPDTRLRFGIP